MIELTAFPFRQSSEGKAREVEDTSSDETTTISNPTSPMQVDDNDAPGKTVPSSHIPGRRQIYFCTIKPCDYESDRKNNLKRHILAMHTESPKLFTCCDQKFTCKAEFRRHTRHVHRSSGYSCELCLLRFDRRALLLRHKSVHSGVKPFKCSCGYATSHKSNLLRHCAKLGHRSTDATVTPRSRLPSRGEAYSSDTSSKSCKNPINGGGSTTISHKQKMKHLTKAMRSRISPYKNDRSFVSSTTEDMPENIHCRSTAAFLHTLMPSHLYEHASSSILSSSYPMSTLHPRPSIYPKAKQAWAQSYYLQQQMRQTHENEVSYQPNLTMQPIKLDYAKHERRDNMNNNNEWSLNQRLGEISNHCITERNGMPLPLKIPALGVESLDKCSQCSKNGGLFSSYVEPLGHQAMPKGSYSRLAQEHSSLPVPMPTIPIAGNYFDYRSSLPLLSSPPHSYGEHQTSNVSLNGYPDDKPLLNHTLSLAESTYNCGSSDNFNHVRLDINGSMSKCTESVTSNALKRIAYNYPSASPMFRSSEVSNGNYSSDSLMYNRSECVTKPNTKCNSFLSLNMPFQPWNHPGGISSFSNGVCNTVHQMNQQEQRNGIPMNVTSKTDNGLQCSTSINHTKVSVAQPKSAFHDRRATVSCKDGSQPTTECMTFSKKRSHQNTTLVEKHWSEPPLVKENTDSPNTSSQSLASTISSSNDDLSPVLVKKETFRLIRPRICFAPYKCFECGISFALQAEYNEHERKHPPQKQAMSMVAVMNQVRICPTTGVEKIGECSSDEHDTQRS